MDIYVFQLYFKVPSAKDLELSKLPLSLQCFFYSQDQSMATNQSNTTHLRIRTFFSTYILSGIWYVFVIYLTSISLVTVCLVDREGGCGLGSDGQVMVIVSLPPPVSDGTWSLWVLGDALTFGFRVWRVPTSCPETFLSFPLATQRLCQNVSPTVPGASVKTNHTDQRSC